MHSARTQVAHALDPLRHFHHPGFASLLGLQRDQDRVFLVMMAPAGETARRWLQRRPRLPETQLRLLLEQLCELCGSIVGQRLCVHLTPDNLWLDDSTGATLLDLGFGGALPLARREREDACGWLAPEAGEDAWQDAAFQYAIAAFGYELLTGEAPAPGAPPLQHAAPDAPPAIVATLDRALASAPVGRHTDLAAMRAALSSIAARKPVQRLAATGTAVAAASARKPLWLAAGGVAMAVLLLAALFLSPLGSSLLESEAERTARQTATRLQPEAQQALAALPTEAGRLDQAARDIQTEIARVESQLATASGESRGSLEKQIAGLRERLEAAAETARRYRALLDDSKHLPALRERLRAADQSLAERQFASAQTQYTQLLEQARTLRESAGALATFMDSRSAHQAARKQLDELAQAETTAVPALGALHERLVLDAELAGGKQDYAAGSRHYGQAADLVRDETRKFRQTRLHAHLGAVRRAAANQDFAAAETALGRAQNVDPQSPEVAQARQDLASQKEQAETARSAAEQRRREAAELAEKQRREQQLARAQAQAAAEARAKAEAEAAQQAAAEREKRQQEERQRSAERRQAGMELCQKEHGTCMEGCNAQVAVEMFSSFLGSRGGGFSGGGGSSACMSNCQYSLQTCRQNLR